MGKDILLIHKVNTNQASEKELLEYNLLRDEQGDFDVLAKDIEDILDLTNSIELPFEVDVDAAFQKFTNAVKHENISSNEAKVVTLNTELKTESNNITEKSKIVTKKAKFFRISNILKIAAMFLVTIGASYLLNQDSNSFDYNSNSGIASHVLSDNSTITLNKGASLVGASDFNKLARKVSLLKGEAFFDIAKNKQKPFIINTGDVEILVTGTAFDITNNEHEIIVSVEEGSVSVSSKGEKFDLKVMDRLVYSKKSKEFNLSQVESPNVFNWVNKELYFESTPLNVVLDDLARFYQVDITYPGMASSGNCLYTSPVFKDKSLESVLENISLTFDLKIVKLKENEIAITDLKCN